MHREAAGHQVERSFDERERRGIALEEQDVPCACGVSLALARLEHRARHVDHDRLRRRARERPPDDPGPAGHVEHRFARARRDVREDPFDQPAVGERVGRVL